MHPLTLDCSFLRVNLCKRNKKGSSRIWGKREETAHLDFTVDYEETKGSSKLFDYDSRLLSCSLSLAVS